MVSMYVDIRRAAELLARYSTGHGLPHIAIEIANEIREAVRQGGLQFYTQYRDPDDGLMHISDPANMFGASFSIAEDEPGKPYVKPHGRIEGGDLKAILEAGGHAYTPGPHDGEWVADCVVSIEDVVKHPYFGFPKEKQDRIVEAHRAAAVANLPTDDALPVAGAPLALSLVVHSTKTRRDTLTPVIEEAQRQSSNPQDVAAVWAALQVQAEKRTAPLIGATEDGLQYLKNGQSAIFNRDALRKRLDRLPPIDAAKRR